MSTRRPLNTMQTAFVEAFPDPRRPRLPVRDQGGPARRLSLARQAGPAVALAAPRPRGGRGRIRSAFGRGSAVGKPYEKLSFSRISLASRSRENWASRKA